MSMKQTRNELSFFVLFSEDSNKQKRVNILQANKNNNNNMSINT